MLRSAAPQKTGVAWLVKVALRIPARSVAASSYGHPYFTRRPRSREMLRKQGKGIDLAVKLTTLVDDIPIEFSPKELRVT